MKRYLRWLLLEFIADQDLVDDGDLYASPGIMEKFKNGIKNFRNPPQPHMCIKDSIRGSKIPCFVNVLSWAQVSMPRTNGDRIPLYGGMLVNRKVPSLDSEHSPPLVFAVMVNPHILLTTGKKAKNIKEHELLVDTLLDFVEAMNPGIHFLRQFQVITDRDLTGELKDIWRAIQLKREQEERRREEYERALRVERNRIIYANNKRDLRNRLQENRITLPLEDDFVSNEEDSQELLNEDSNSNCKSCSEQDEGEVDVDCKCPDSHSDSLKESGHIVKSHDPNNFDILYKNVNNCQYDENEINICSCDISNEVKSKSQGDSGSSAVVKLDKINNSPSLKDNAERRDGSVNSGNANNVNLLV